MRDPRALTTVEKVWNNSFLGSHNVSGTATSLSAVGVHLQAWTRSTMILLAMCTKAVRQRSCSANRPVVLFCFHFCFPFTVLFSFPFAFYLGKYTSQMQSGDSSTGSDTPGAVLQASLSRAYAEGLAGAQAMAIDIGKTLRRMAPVRSLALLLRAPELAKARERLMSNESSWGLPSHGSHIS